MCGRYTLRRIDLIRAALDAAPTLPFEEFTDRPRFNMAPGQVLPIVRLSARGRREIAMAKWGLVPADVEELPKLQPINARGETVASTPMFRDGMRNHRCLVPADGFYEWRGKHAPKTPFYIHMNDDSLFAFAGIWQTWRGSDTFTLITTTPNALVKPIHNRMPVILHKKDYSTWLNPDTPVPAAVELLHPFEAEKMLAYSVSTKVNAVGREGEELIKPEKEETLFGE